MKVIKYPAKEEWSEIVKRPHLDVSQLNATVQGVLDDVKNHGDDAVKRYEEKHQILNEMLFRFEAVRSAQDKKYVMMNAPKAKVAEITQVLPGIKSPTIIPLADEEWCSIHTVLDEKRFWEIIGKLKELGAQGILVTPIEKMIL